MKIEAIIAIILLAAVALTMGGCSTVSEWVATEPEAVEFVVKRGTREYIDGDQDRREKVIQFTEDMRTYIDGNPEARASQIIGLAREKIRWERFDELQTRIVSKLLEKLEDRIAKAEQGRFVEDDEAVPLLDVLDWVEQAAYE